MSFKYKKIITSLSLSICLAASSFLPVHAETDYMAEMEERKSLPIESNQISNWPEGPSIGAKSAIVMEMNTHTILYAKNIYEKMYPASTTKILTCLLAEQNCSMKENVKFSYDAVHDVPRDGSNMGMDAGEIITMEQALYGVLVGSANEAASAVAEHVAQAVTGEPSISNFVKMMNDKASSLGCKNSHFVNANGLYDDNHYTCAYDLALIGSEFFANEMLCKMSSTNSYHIPVSDTQPDDIWIRSKNQLYKGKTYAYDYLLGSKTGYVSQARETLVSGASKDGMDLVCVVFMEESPYQFIDTVTLFQYAFDNFKLYNVSDYESKYNIQSDDIFVSDNDLFGNSNSLLSLNKKSYVVLPTTASFDDVNSDITIYPSSDNDDNVIATINYNYYGQNVGSCDILFSDITKDDTISDYDDNVIFLNIIYILLGIVAFILLIFIISNLISYVSSFNFTNKRETRRRRKDRKKQTKLELKRLHDIKRNQKRLLRQRRNAYKKRRK